MSKAIFGIKYQWLRAAAVIVEAILFLTVLTSSVLAHEVISILDNPNGIGEGRFGSAIDHVGDIDGDEFPDIVIGAPGQSVGGRNAQGQVYIFSGATGFSIRTLDSPYLWHDANFGQSVLATGDLDGDQVSEIAIEGPAQAAHYVYSGRTGVLLRVLRSPLPGVHLGLAAGGHDLNSDSVPDIVVGARGDNPPAGAVFAFSGADWSLIYTIFDPNPVSGSFGDRVAMLGDINSDGVSDIAVGAWEHEREGQVFVFSGADGNLLYSIDPPEHAPSFGGFGRGISNVSDLNGDAIPELIVGYASVGQSAYVFSGVDGSLLLILKNPLPAEGGFGWNLEDAGDLNGDRLPEIAVSQGDSTCFFSGEDGSYLFKVPGGLAIRNIGDVTGDAVDDFAAGSESQHRVFLYDLVQPGEYDPCPDVPGNLLQNYCFEDGPGPWTFWTDGAGTYLTSSANPYQGQFAADVAVAQAGSNVQFYQKDIALKPNTKYELSFAAYSSNGNNLGVYLQKHSTPYTNYGLNNVVVDLTTGWKVYRTTFTTTGFTTPVKDARLRFWLAPYDANGMRYHIDWAALREVDVANPPIPPDPPVIVPPPGQCKPPNPTNLIHNPGFESGKTSWTFVTDGTGSFTTANTDPYECANNARVSIGSQGTNVQLYQRNVALQGGKTYQLRLAARSNGGQDVQLFLHKHGAPYNNYGLNGVTLDLTPAWTVFVVEFTAAGSVPLTDGRLRLWLGPFDQNGANFEFDDVVLLPKSAVTAQGEQVAAGTNGRERMATRGVAAASHLTQGYFLEGDESGRLAGAYVPDNGSSLCYNARPSLSRLLPANGKFAKVAILGSGRPQNVVITAITQNEPVGVEPDGAGLGTPWAMLRRERDADGEGRVYHVAFTASYQGRSCSHEVVVTVPVDQHPPLMDSGATYDAMMATE